MNPGRLRLREDAERLAVAHAATLTRASEAGTESGLDARLLDLARIRLGHAQARDRAQLQLDVAA